MSGRATEPPRIYRVAELNRIVRTKIERWGEVWVEGEISDVTRSGSGHVYLTLDDGAEASQLRAVMFRADARFSRAKMVLGERVRLLGILSLYEPRGTFQMLARLALPTGAGDKRAELERLKQKLAAEGLFARERKRRLPRVPEVVGLVTSRDGAALHDVIRVASARAPVRLVVAHCQVQGPEAPASIVRAIRRLCRMGGVSVLIVTRGGGASEDLGAFNDERVARAIAECPIPVVSGVGHEIDETIADLVADVRAATPSNAAEIAVPDRALLATEIDTARRRLQRALEVAFGRERFRLERLERRVADPRRMLFAIRHRLLHERSALEREATRALARERAALTTLTHRLQRLDPRAALASDRAELQRWTQRLRASLPSALVERRAALVGWTQRLRATPRAWLDPRERAIAQHRAVVLANGRPTIQRDRARYAELVSRLHALSPLSILARGYAIAVHEKSGRVLRDAAEAAPGDAIEVRLGRGRLRAVVDRAADDATSAKRTSRKRRT